MKGLYLLLMRLRVLKHRLELLYGSGIGARSFPVLNKIDLPSANRSILEEIETIGIDSIEAVSVSAKTGWE